VNGFSSGNGIEGGPGVEGGPGDGICGLAEPSDGDLAEAVHGVEYWQSRSTVAQFIQRGRVSSHCQVSLLE
jgi:hypothetical protein